MRKMSPTFSGPTSNVMKILAGAGGSMHITDICEKMASLLPPEYLSRVGDWAGERAQDDPTYRAIKVTRNAVRQLVNKGELVWDKDDDWISLTEAGIINHYECMSGMVKKPDLKTLFDLVVKYIDNSEGNERHNIRINYALKLILVMEGVIQEESVKLRTKVKKEFE